MLGGLPLVLAGCGRGRGPQVTVLAASSLEEALREVAELAGERLRVEPELMLGGSHILVRQILGGAPAHVFISADAASMDRLEEAGKILRQSRIDLLGNRLAVIGPPGGGLDFAQVVEREELRVALGHPASVPVGRYARQWLEKRGWWDRLRRRAVFFDNVRAVLSAVEAGDVQAGIVYATDAAVGGQVRVLQEVPAEEMPDIRYPAAVLVDAPPEALRFHAFLQEEPAAAVFRRRGFLVPAAG